MPGEVAVADPPGAPTSDEAMANAARLLLAAEAHAETNPVRAERLHGIGDSWLEYARLYDAGATVQL
jgi:hypothetical protein